MEIWRNVGLTALVSGYAGVTSVLFDFMFQTQPTPYLDEVFHIPQAMHYCAGNFTVWDPKITTLPGLYLLSIGFLKPLSWLLSTPDLCLSVYALRSINLIISTSMLYVIFCLHHVLHGHENKMDLLKNLLTALNISIFPVLYFFNFLYYTDVASAFVTLLMYLLALEQQYIFSSAVGFIAVCMRQTNIIWMALCGLMSLSHILRDHAIINKEKFTVSVRHSQNYVEMLWLHAVRPALLNSSRGKAVILDLLCGLSGYIATAFSFILFYFYNGSLVVGDRNAHQASFHLTQLLYFSMFVLAFMWPLALQFGSTFLMSLRRYYRLLLFVVLTMVFVIHYNSLAHPYLLADNRHYTFYLWRRVINWNTYSRFYLIPAYVLGGMFICHILRNCDFIFQVGFCFCLIVSTVPQALLEFRYFIIPYIILRLQVPKPEIWQLVLEFGLYLLINIATIVVFITRTIHWPNMEDPQRFMW